MLLLLLLLQVGQCNSYMDRGKKRGCIVPASDCVYFKKFNTMSKVSALPPLLGQPRIAQPLPRLTRTAITLCSQSLMPFVKAVCNVPPPPPPPQPTPLLCSPPPEREMQQHAHPLLRLRDDAYICVEVPHEGALGGGPLGAVRGRAGESIGIQEGGREGGEREGGEGLDRRPLMEPALFLV